MENSKSSIPFNLTKYLSNSGIASRRQSAELIKNGQVQVNGKIELNPGRRIMENDCVVFLGKEVTPPDRRYYIMLHKPRGYVCTNEDIHAPKKALDLIQFPGCPRLFSAGRLDKNSEGLILFSNDGVFVEQLTHPRHEVYKTYDVSTEYELSEQNLQQFLQGIWDNGELLKAAAVIPLTPYRVRLILGEGKNREIRRMVQSFQNNTKRLKRIAVGCLELGGLPCGEWRELTPREILLAQKRPRELDHKGGLPAGGIPVEKTEQGRFSVKKTLQSGRKNNSSHHHKRSENFSNSSSHTDQYRKNKFYRHNKKEVS